MLNYSQTVARLCLSPESSLVLTLLRSQVPPLVATALLRGRVPLAAKRTLAYFRGMPDNQVGIS